MLHQEKIAALQKPSWCDNNAYEISISTSVCLSACLLLYSCPYLCLRVSLYWSTDDDAKENDKVGDAKLMSDNEYTTLSFDVHDQTHAHTHTHTNTNRYTKTQTCTHTCKRTQTHPHRDIHACLSGRRWHWTCINICMHAIRYNYLRRPITVFYARVICMHVCISVRV